VEPLDSQQIVVTWRFDYLSNSCWK